MYLLKQIVRNERLLVGAIDTMWESKASSKHFIWVTGFELSGVDEFYGMRKIFRTKHHAVISTQVRAIGSFSYFT
jgi:hypothetical protein